MPHPDLPWRIEHTCFKAYPALEQVILGQWLLRFSDGMSRRANSINPLVSDCPDIDATIDAAEPRYRGRGLPTIFRVPSFVSPQLDSALAARNYAQEGESCVLHCKIEALEAENDAAVVLLPMPLGTWLSAMVRLQGYTPAQAAAYRRIIEAIAVPVRFAALMMGGEPAALAFGAVHELLLCYESVIVARELRRQGLARRVMGALASWARGDGVDGVCLQVQTDNTAARPLYARLGLREVYRYHYRREPSRRETPAGTERGARKPAQDRRFTPNRWCCAVLRGH